MQKSLVEEAYKRAIKVVKKCSTPHGLFASGERYGYTSVWARDSMITLLGAALVENKLFKKDFVLSLNTLAKYQDDLGQIPNCVDLFDKRRPKQVTFATIDSSLWFLIGLYYYKKLFKENKLIAKHRKKANKAFLWLRYQDSGGDFLPDQQPTTDWQDCFPHKYGHTINTQAVYYAALKISGRKKMAEKVKEVVNGHFKKHLSMFDEKKGYYLPYVWKDHEGIREQGNWFDSLGNLLAIVFGLTDRKRARKIMRYIDFFQVNKPYPVRVLFPPITPESKDWHNYFSKCLAGRPNWYLNGGIWPFVGGFYVSALVVLKEFEKAEQQLQLLAKANSLGRKYKWEFNEWINPITARAQGGAYQAWSAGGYLLAYYSVREKKFPVFKTKL
jgi:glycogen debranching enzyme